MSDLSAVPVASGRPYLIIDVSDRPPTSLTDFIGHHSITINTNTPDVLWIVGQGASDPRGIKFYEKGSDGVGKDIRVWHISRASDGTSFQAEQVASA